ncbi:glutamate synthase large subunit [Akkermansia sp.]|uniref:glutamate synthase large subunit n=1 Tax=Akkermansia sp. TaxID=1872421 RepID=UPI0039957169
MTNPPIDPIREELVMSLTTYIGNHPNILEETPEHARLIKMERPVITDEELNSLCNIREAGFPSARLSIQFPEGGDGKVLRAALDNLAESAVGLVRSGVRILALTDRNIGRGYLPVPSLLACSVVHRALAAEGLRSDAGLIVETGEARETMHFALLLGFGATAVNPYLALATVTSLAAPQDCPLDVVKASGNYIRAIDKGLLKIMSKMGISTLRSYRSSQLFEAVGLNRDLIDEFFPGTVSRVGGIGLEEIAAECNQRTAQAAGEEGRLDAGGQYKYRKGGENHLWNPQTLQAFRAAVRDNDERKYREFADYSNHQAQHLCTLRGLFEFVPAEAVPVEEVESVDSILRRFVSGAMSLGSLSPEAHETIAIAMNKIGAKSNSGEGGEDEARYEPNARGEVRYSAIKQIASGRFGVTINYLRHASELQIKMAQGAKPGEGGQLPAHKVDPYIARLRHSMPNVSLISPPPHHDIYSIEDLAQLIYDLRNSNPEARVSVKLVSEVGIGAVAAGVVKAHADMVVVSGHDGGTGASPLTSVKHAGLPWELGLAETQQTLVLNKLRSRVRLQVDGQLRTGRDVVMAALLGAEEFGFGTAILISIGCAMLRRCHENTCPVGVATQDPALRAKFSGKPEYVINYLRFVAQETREILASLGLRSLDEAVGRTDLLSVNRAIDFYKAQHLDFSSILHAAEGDGRRFDPSFEREPLDNYDRRHLLPDLRPLLEKGEKSELFREIRNVDRTVGTELSGELVMKFGPRGLAEDTLTVHFTGCAGQSFGAFLAPGITFELVGEANDFVGKGLSGGKIVVRPPENISYVPSDNVIAGNVIGYGATSGKIFLHGQAGERFAIRNSGATMVVEGVGDHGCEYMTGGRVAVLGKVGVNFAAGMTGGLAYVYDADNNFDQKCNLGSVDLETVMPHSADEAELLQLIYEHYMATGSRRACGLLSNWLEERGKFIKVFPVEYRHALAMHS